MLVGVHKIGKKKITIIRILWKTVRSSAGNRRPLKNDTKIVFE